MHECVVLKYRSSDYSASDNIKVGVYTVYTLSLWLAERDKLMHTGSQTIRLILKFNITVTFKTRYLQLLSYYKLQLNSVIREDWQQ